MEPRTIGRIYQAGKVAQIACKDNDSLAQMDIEGKCFLMLLVLGGEANIAIGSRQICAKAPCFVCFDERDAPVLIEKQALFCHSVYFHPQFFNENLTFARVHSDAFAKAALEHDLFMMRPFADRENAVFPLHREYVADAERLYAGLASALAEQSDGYWSCRARTCFIRLIFLLERAYSTIGGIATDGAVDHVENPNLKEAVHYIEGHYREEITLSRLAQIASVNHTTLTTLFRKELGMPPIACLWHHRIRVAKRELQFTSLPIKEIASQCGFKTAGHFTKKFTAIVGVGPVDFRAEAQSRRIAALNDFSLPQKAETNPSLREEYDFLIRRAVHIEGTYNGNPHDFSVCAEDDCGTLFCRRIKRAAEELLADDIGTRRICRLVAVQNGRVVMPPDRLLDLLCDQNLENTQIGVLCDAQDPCLSVAAQEDCFVMTAKEIFDLREKKSKQIADEFVPLHRAAKAFFPLPSEDDQVVCLETAEGEIIPFRYHNSDENDEAAVPAQAKGRRLVRILALWSNGALDIPCRHLRRHLLALPPENGEATVLLLGRKRLIWRRLKDLQ